MKLKRLEISGFKSFATKTTLVFDAPITSIVGPNGSGKSNVAESIRWVLGEQSMKSLRGKRGEDLIFNGAASSGRQNRASVSLVFDNKDGAFKLSNTDEGEGGRAWDEVTITREVFRDGSNNYLINGSVVRLRDVLELLSAVSLGPTGHHIISQGEADRILNANFKERREMLEDALGLKIYQFKIGESEKRLEKTEENIKQVESLRREIAPHIKFLKKQVEEAEKLSALREELAQIAKEYFVNEEAYLSATKTELQNEIKGFSHELARLAREIKEAEENVRKADKGKINDGAGGEIDGPKFGLESKLANLRNEKDEIMRERGKLEAKLEAVKIEEFVVRDKVSGKDKCRYCGQEIARGDKVGASEEDLAHLRDEKRRLEDKYQGLGQSERALLAELDGLHKAELSTSEEARAAERVLYDLRAKRATFEGKLATSQVGEGGIKNEYDNLSREAHEVSALVGASVLSGVAGGPSSRDGGVDASRDAQALRRKKLERLKIKLEDAGGVGTEVIKEYQDTSKRDEYLVHELADLETSKKSLRNLLKDLSETLEHKFKDGLLEVNKEFEQFFTVLFGGGNASLHTVKLKQPKTIVLGDEVVDMPLEEGEEGEDEFGIDINVSLPRKKIKGLDMLSGGERALTSIALLFAMSQVNPPPFLVLDETDAALDEANARKYGQMLKTLSGKSQLIVVTHNRETMSHADIIYGVTMGSDGISKLLSIRFDDATAYAK